MSAPGVARLNRTGAIWLLVGGALLLVGAAHAHLVYVALRSQPDCVDHLRPGQASGNQARFSAAKSACVPR